MPSTPRIEPIIKVPEAFDAEFPGCSRLATETFLNIGVLTGTVQGVVEKLVAAEGLPSAAAFNVLSVLAGASAPLRPSEIAQRMMVTRATTSGLLDTLVKHDLIRKAPTRDDGRALLVTITDRGREIVGRLVPAMHQFEHELMGVLTDAQLRRLLELVAILQARVAAIRPDVPSGIR